MPIDRSVGIECLLTAHPDVHIHLAAVDERLNDIGFIVPGLGDAVAAAARRAAQGQRRTARPALQAGRRREGVTAMMDVPATRSALLALKNQLAFAEEGYSLLDQKRELLLLEIVARRRRAAEVRRAAGSVLKPAFAALRCALLDAGAAAVDRAALGAAPAGPAAIKERRLMGVRLAEASSEAQVPSAAFGPGGSPDIHLRLDYFEHSGKTAQFQGKTKKRLAPRTASGTGVFSGFFLASPVIFSKISRMSRAVHYSHESASAFIAWNGHSVNWGDIS